MFTNAATLLEGQRGFSLSGNQWPAAVLLLQLGVCGDGHVDPTARMGSLAESARHFWCWSRFAVGEFRVP